MDSSFFSSIFDFISQHRTTIAVVGVSIALAQLFAGVIDRLSFKSRKHEHERVVLVEDAEGDRAAVVVDPTDPESIERMLEKIRSFEAVPVGGANGHRQRPAATRASLRE